MWLVKLVATILVVALFIEGQNASFDLANQPSDVWVLVGTLLGGVVLFSSFWALYFIWRAECKKVNDWFLGF